LYRTVYLVVKHTPDPHIYTITLLEAKTYCSKCKIETSG
jgi:hypothetical protein